VKFKFNLVDDVSDRKVVVKASLAGTEGAVLIEVEGLENEHGNPLLSIDLFDGKLKLFAWTDQAGEEYTHVLNLDSGQIEEAP
jgi:hypothetical protein